MLLRCYALLTLCLSSRAVAFVPRSVAGAGASGARPATWHMCAARAGSSRLLTFTLKPDRDLLCEERGGTTRGDIARIVGAAVAGTLAVDVLPGSAARTRSELIQLLGDARKQLDPVDRMIEDAKWDAIRNIIKTSPLADIKNVIAELARQADEDESALLLGLRQDVLDHVQYLDSFSYNNVFVGEERQILGTKIDFDTPRMELRQAREAFDIIMEVLPPVDE